MARRIEQRLFRASACHCDCQAAFRIQRIADFRLQPAGIADRFRSRFQRESDAHRFRRFFGRKSPELLAPTAASAVDMVCAVILFQLHCAPFAFSDPAGNWSNGRAEGCLVVTVGFGISQAQDNIFALAFPVRDKQADQPCAVVDAADGHAVRLAQIDAHDLFRSDAAPFADSDASHWPSPSPTYRAGRQVTSRSCPPRRGRLAPALQRRRLRSQEYAQL